MFARYFLGAIVALDIVLLAAISLACSAQHVELEFENGVRAVKQPDGKYISLDGDSALDPLARQFILLQNVDDEPQFNSDLADVNTNSVYSILEPQEDQMDSNLANLAREMKYRYQIAGDGFKAQPSGRDLSGPINNPAQFEIELSDKEQPLNGTWSTADAIFVALKSQQAEEPAGHQELQKPQRHSGSEYVDRPLALAGHQYVQGGAGEGRQLLGPEGSFENVQVVKSDLAVPSYCDPPNPCPIGYTAADGCLEEFVNSAGFSRDYQVKQKCSCDNEHSLFNCAAPVPTPNSISGSRQSGQVVANNRQQNSQQGGPAFNEIEDRLPLNKLKTLARAIQNRFGDLDSVQNLIAQRPLIAD